MSIKKKEFIKISIITILFLCLITAWLAFGKRGFIHLYRLEEERQTYLERIHELESTNQELLEEIRKLKTENDYIESIARKELGMIKDNELIFRFNKDHSYNDSEDQSDYPSDFQEENQKDNQGDNKKQ